MSFSSQICNALNPMALFEAYRASTTQPKCSEKRADSATIKYIIHIMTLQRANGILRSYNNSCLSKSNMPNQLKVYAHREDPQLVSLEELERLKQEHQVLKVAAWKNIQSRRSHVCSNLLTTLANAASSITTVFKTALRSLFSE